MEGSGGNVVVAYKDRKIFLWNPELSGADSRGEILFSDDEALKIQEEVFWLRLQIQSSNDLYLKMTYGAFRKRFFCADYPKIFEIP